MVSLCYKVLSICFLLSEHFPKVGRYYIHFKDGELELQRKLSDFIKSWRKLAMELNLIPDSGHGGSLLTWRKPGNVTT